MFALNTLFFGTKYTELGLSKFLQTLHTTMPLKYKIITS